MKKGVQLMFDGMLGLDMRSRQDIQSQAYENGYVVSNDGSIWERGHRHEKVREELDKIAGVYRIKVIEVDIRNSVARTASVLEATA